eukprot:13172862-Alexandrium_andersonii.AAC.1
MSAQTPARWHCRKRDTVAAMRQEFLGARLGQVRFSVSVAVSRESSAVSGRKAPLSSHSGFGGKIA